MVWGTALLVQPLIIAQKENKISQGFYVYPRRENSPQVESFLKQNYQNIHKYMPDAMKEAWKR